MFRLTSVNKPKSLYVRPFGSLGILSSGFGGFCSPLLGFVGSIGMISSYWYTTVVVPSFTLPVSSNTLLYLSETSYTPRKTYFLPSLLIVSTFFSAAL